MGEAGWNNVTMALSQLFIGDMGVDRNGYQQTRLGGKALVDRAQALIATLPSSIYLKLT